jgi:hypothetical protein
MSSHNANHLRENVDRLKVSDHLALRAPPKQVKAFLDKVPRSNMNFCKAVCTEN